MYELILENAAGDQLKFGMGTPFSIVDIQGLNPPAATVNTNQLALMDGAKYNSAKVEMRTLDIAFAIELDPPKNRIQVYKVLKSKQYVKIIYNGKYRKVYLEGYVTGMPITYFDMKQIVTCSILCPYPYWKEAQEIASELSNVVKAFHFPFSSTAEPQLVFGYYSTDLGLTVVNEGDVACGMMIDLYANDTVVNPKIYNYITGEFIGLNITMYVGDLITIDTNAGHKTVTLLRNGEVINVFNVVLPNSTWLQLAAGNNTFVYEVETGLASSLLVTFRHYNLYEGV